MLIVQINCGDKVHTKWLLIWIATGNFQVKNITISDNEQYQKEFNFIAMHRKLCARAFISVTSMKMVGASIWSFMFDVFHFCLPVILQSIQWHFNLSFSHTLFSAVLNVVGRYFPLSMQKVNNFKHIQCLSNADGVKTFISHRREKLK